MAGLLDRPEVMAEAIACLVRRLGGDVTITTDESFTRCTLEARSENGELRLIVTDQTPAPRKLDS